jgi:tetratricopeptide (TPR) repeat protein
MTISPSIRIISLTFLVLLANLSFAQQTNMLQRAESLKMSGNYLAAAQTFDTLSKLQPKNNYYLAEKGFCLINSGKSNEGRIAIIKASELNNKCDRCFAALAFLEMAENNSGLALSYANKAIAAAPNEAYNYYVRAQIYVAKGQTFEALDDYEKALLLAPKNADIWYSKALLNNQENKYALAVSDLNKAIEITAKPEYYYQRGQGYYQLGKFELAYTDVFKAIQLDSTVAKYFVALGASLEYYEAFGNALDAYNKAISLDSQNYLGFYNRALLFYRTENLDRSCSDIIQALQRIKLAQKNKELVPREHESVLNEIRESICDFSSPAYFYQRGLLAQNRKNHKMAIEIFQEGLKKDPNHPMLLTFLGNSCFETKNYHEALRHYDSALVHGEIIPADVNNNKQLLRKYDGNPAIYMKNLFAGVYLSKAKAFLMLNKYKDAIQQAENSIFLANKVPDYPSLAYHKLILSFALVMDQQFDKAFAVADDLIVTKDPGAYTHIAKMHLSKAIFSKKKAIPEYGFYANGGLFVKLSKGFEASKVMHADLQKAAESVAVALEMNSQHDEALIINMQLKFLRQDPDFCADLVKLKNIKPEFLEEISGLECK